ncbi:MAG: hypothetical protein JNK02_12380 [Planctomycetes bacterium]|nr:hypothetical protein [Planctomycetota bacterium]
MLEALVALLLAPVAALEGLRRASGGQGLAEIRDTEVGIVLDAWSGERRVVDTPGYRPYLPWLQEVHTIDKSPNAFTFQGNRTLGLNHVPRLLVRARDGSSFWFEEITLQYALRVERAGAVLEDSGGGDAFKEELLRSHARAILRDEFGRYAAVDAGKPEALQAATRQSLERLNAALASHGIEVLEVSSPRPAFDKGYEDLINRRKLANQETERIQTQLASRAAAGSLREEQVRSEKALELEKLEGNLARDVGAAEKERVRAFAEAEVAWAERVSQGRIAKAEKELQAAVLEAQVRGLAEDARAHAESLRLHGAGLVRAALVEQLRSTAVQIVPYSRDAAPQRIEHEGTAEKP